VGETMAYNTGQGAWVAADDAQYVQKAASFASDLQALSALRAQLRQTVLQSPLYDAKQFAKHLTQALTQMWAAYSAADDAANR
jgi:protein O-GlcNAc transferase